MKNNILAQYPLPFWCHTEPPSEDPAENENGNEINISGYGDALNDKIKGEWLFGQLVDVWNINEQQPTATSSDDNEDKKSLIARAWRSPPMTMAKVTAEVTASEKVEKIETPPCEALRL